LARFVVGKMKMKMIEMLQPDNLDRLLGRSLFFFFFFFFPGSFVRPAAKFFFTKPASLSLTEHLEKAITRE